MFSDKDIEIINANIEWFSVIEWTEEMHEHFNLPYERISYLWERYNVVQFMLDCYDLYQTHDMYLDDIKGYIEEQGGSLY